MFVHKIDEELSLKLIELKDAERVFELTNQSKRISKRMASLAGYYNKT